jgi:hypothetical protein
MAGLFLPFSYRDGAFRDGDPCLGPESGTDRGGVSSVYWDVIGLLHQLRGRGGSTRATVSSLIEGITYYMAVTAYDTSGNQSGYSDEIVYTVPGGAVPEPSTALRAAAAAGGALSQRPRSEAPWLPRSNG